MPLGIVVTQSERDIIEEVWPAPGENDPKIVKTILHIKPGYGRSIVSSIQDSTHGDRDQNAERRLVNRIVDLCGPDNMLGDKNPVDTADTADYKYDNEAVDSADNETEQD